MSTTVPANPEAIFTYGAPQLKYGPGASDEIGFDLSQYQARRVLVVTDPGVAATGHPQRVAEQLARVGIEAQVFDGVHVEPTDASLASAIGHARGTGPWDAFVAVGGGSSIDTAKAVNLLLTNPGELMDYINVPVGKGAAPVNPLKPLIAVPTTTGTGAESTTICVLDVLALKVKTGISHARRHGDDTAAPADMAMAATFAGLGSGNAGVHIPHANGYPIAGRVREFHPKDSPAHEPMVPHGMSVALTAPEAFRFTFAATPQRHPRAAELLAPNTEQPADDSQFLPSVLISLMREISMPNGIAAVGYAPGDIPDLVDGTLKQQRLLATSPRAVTGDDVAAIFARSMELW
jgi:alcohol dehydrogenase class IV